VPSRTLQHGDEPDRALSNFAERCGSQVAG